MPEQNRFGPGLRAVFWISGLVLLISTTLLSAPVVSDDTDGAYTIRLTAVEKKGVKSITGKELIKYVAHLASDDFEGREAGSEMGHEAGAFLASEFKRLGLKPGGKKETYFQPFSLSAQVSQVSLQESNLVEVTRSRDPKKGGEDRTFRFQYDFIPLSISASVMVDPSEVTFVGFGISEREKGYDDYQRAKVSGRVVVALDHVPMEGEEGPFTGEEETYSDPLYKAKIAEENGAVALIVVKDILNHPGEVDVPKDLLKGWPPQEAAPPVDIPVVYASQEMATFILGGKDPAKLQGKIEKKGKPASLKIASRYVRLEIASFGQAKGAGRNVIAILEGTDDELKGEAVVIGAHYDHVGFGRSGGSRGRPGQVHNGANDNASGTSGVLEVAEAFAQNKVPVRRSIIFIGFDGEEKGLLGSRHYVTDPTIPIDKTIAMLNMDMIGVNKKFEVFIGAGQENRTLEESHVAANRIVGLEIRYDQMDGLRNRSDQGPFLDAGVPALFFYAGSHPEYHTPSDDAVLINRGLIEGIARLVFITALDIANRDAPP